MSEIKVTKGKWTISRGISFGADAYGITQNGKLIAIVQDKEFAEEIKVLADSKLLKQLQQ